MPQFQRRNTQPMRPDNYRRIARLLREISYALDAAAGGADRHQRGTLTTRLHGLSRSSAAWWQRHLATINGTLHVPPKKP